MNVTRSRPIAARRCWRYCRRVPKKCRTFCASVIRWVFPWCRAGAGTSLAGGALPTADCVILGVARMNEVLETDYDNRFIRVQTGRTNLSVSGAVEEEEFFYAPIRQVSWPVPSLEISR